MRRVFVGGLETDPEKKKRKRARKHFVIKQTHHLRPRARQVHRVHVLDRRPVALSESDGVRVAHRDAGDEPRVTPGAHLARDDGVQRALLERRGLARRGQRRGDEGGRERRRAHVDADQAVAQHLGADDPGTSRDRRRRVCISICGRARRRGRTLPVFLLVDVGDEPREAPDPVAAHLRLGPVTVVDAHGVIQGRGGGSSSLRGRGAGLRRERRQREDDAVAADAEVAVADLGGLLGRDDGEVLVAVVDLFFRLQGGRERG